MCEQQQLGVHLLDVVDAGHMERVAGPRVLPQLVRPELGVLHLVRAEVDEVRVDEVCPVADSDGLVLELVGAHVDDGPDLLVPGRLGLIPRADVPDVVEVDEGDLILLVVKVEKESIWIDFQCDGNTGAILFQSKL